MIYLHVGRSKSGSTTIQHFLLAQAELLRDNGYVVPRFGASPGSHAEVQRALRDGRDDDPALTELRRLIDEHRDEHLVLSSEFFLYLGRSFPDAITRLRDLTADTPVRVIAYLRSYTEWLTSLYVQESRKGLTLDDFDTWLARMLETDRVSALPSLEAWADVFGWDAMYVRPLTRAALVDGDLVKDFSAAIGVDLPPVEAEDVNLAWPWQLSEFRRALAQHLPRGPVDKRVGRDMRSAILLFQKCLEAYEATETPPQYLTLAQRAELNDLFNADLARIAQLTGDDIAPLVPPERPERPALPSLDDVDPRVMALFAGRVLRPGFRARQPSEVLSALDALIAERGLQVTPRRRRAG